MPFLTTTAGGSSRGFGNFNSSGSVSEYEYQYYLVMSMDSGGDYQSNHTTYAFEGLNEGNGGINFTPYDNIPTGWDRMILTSELRGCAWTLNNDNNSRIMLESLCNPIADWPAGNNSKYNVNLQSGSCRYATTSGTHTKQFQHNNGGTESHDIVTLGNTGGSVWSTGMYWGNIDSTSNYAGILNRYDGPSGSGGGNTGDTLYVYLDYDYSNNVSDYVNYLTPTGPLGNATNFTWTNSGGGNQAGSTNYVADAVNVTSGGWTSYGFQQNGNESWIQVDLGSGNETSFDYTFVVGYTGGTHSSTTNFVEGSNDNSTWKKVAEWNKHNNNNANDSSEGYLMYSSGSWSYDNVISNIGCWHAMKDRTPYRYWRLRGTNFNSSNGYQLVMNWALLKRST